MRLLTRGLAAHLCALVGALAALALTAPAWAANAPTYTDSAGTRRTTQGVILQDAAGAFVSPPTAANVDQLEGYLDGVEALIGTTNTTLTAGVALLSGNFQLAPTVTVDAGAYAAGDALADVLTVTGAARTSGGTGFVDAIRIKSAGGSTNAVWIYAWSKTPAATCTKNAAFAASASDNAYALPGFPMTATLGGAPGAWDTATYAQFSGFTANYDNQDTSPGTAIYLCLVTGAIVTPAATTDLSLVVGGVRD